MQSAFVDLGLERDTFLYVSDFFEEHDDIADVYYPGLPSHPQHELAKRQMHGFGGMVSFKLRGPEARAFEFVKHTKLFSLAESLGGVESLIEHPAIMTHASIPPANRAALEAHLERLLA